MFSQVITRKEKLGACGANLRNVDPRCQDRYVGIQYVKMWYRNPRNIDF